MWFTALDQAAYTFAITHQQEFFWRTITILGDPITLAIIVIALVLFIKERESKLLLIATASSALIISTVLKYGFDRVRPDGSTLLTPAFPSGHALGATAVYGIIAYVLWKQQYRWQAGLLLIIPLLVGISRVMLLEHWATDVLGGWIIGALIVLVTIFSTKRLLRKSGTRYRGT